MDREKQVDELIEFIKQEMTDEEVLDLLVEKKFSNSINEIESEEHYTLGQRAADRIARFAGSWTFIFIFTGLLVVWMLINVYFIQNPFDPYPFILLNLVLSCIAAIQAPLIMMSQNRQEEKDRERAQNDYNINLKSEIAIEDLHKKLDHIEENQNKILEVLCLDGKSVVSETDEEGADIRELLED